MKLKNTLIPLLILGAFSCQNETSENNSEESIVETEQIKETSINSDNIIEDSINNYIPVNSEGDFMGIYEALITDELYHEIAKIDHSEMLEQGGYDETATVIRYFKANAFSIEVAYAQIIYIKGEVREASYVFFYPDPNSDEPKLSSEIYSIQDKNDFPCELCSIEDIRTEGDYIIGEFTDDVTSEKFIKYMDYNFVEMWMFWADKP